MAKRKDAEKYIRGPVEEFGKEKLTLAEYNALDDMLVRRNVRVTRLALQLTEFLHFAIGIRGLSQFAINARKTKVRLRGKRSVFLQG